MAIVGQIKGGDWERFSHCGWFYACPVYIGNLESEGPTIAARNFVPEWWLTVNEFVLGACIFVLSNLDPEWEPVFPIRVTGKLKKVGSDA